MDCGGSSARTTTRCRQCSTTLTVTTTTRAVQCAQCHCVTRVQTRAPAPPQLVRMPSAGAFPCVRGKKRALLIGVKYSGRQQGCELRGPINDVKCMKNMLTQRFCFPSDCIVVLTDEERNPCRLPTKANIRAAMHWLVQGTSYGDSLVFQFSGRGAQVPDENCDEEDGFDEAICPMDSFTQGPILDDEINLALVRPLVHGVKLHAVVDACHSSTVLDLPYQCKMSNKSGCWSWEDQRLPRSGCKGTNGGQAVLISGFSHGKKKPSAANGAASIGVMTHSFIKALECSPRATYGHLLTSMRAIMHQGGSCNLQGPIGVPNCTVTNFSGVEEPELSSSRKFDIHREMLCL